MSLLYKFLPLLILAHLVFEHYLCIKFPTAPRLYYLNCNDVSILHEIPIPRRRTACPSEISRKLKSILSKNVYIFQSWYNSSICWISLFYVRSFCIVKFPQATTDTFITCSTLSDSDEGAKVKGARKGGKGKRKGERACDHFLYDPLPPTFGTFEIIRFWLSNCWRVNDLEFSSNSSPPFLLPVSCRFLSCSRFLNSADPTISEGQHFQGLRNRY